jgi:hypothetical protein
MVCRLQQKGAVLLLAVRGRLLQVVESAVGKVETIESAFIQ